ncbi:hypothetical protein QMK19_31995 [Streptomyces sp. H10-C2]|uniref:hypothetical protein n=1 Tax=unclassified Streptomyces TaxID=2593676 RepID=UPI0024B96327|nr:MULTISPECIES: hypothetical protein [unclassified Streptomyces]MDJ0345164.1 hypothetical protein [Streptomyces sp. PH10-H1]MDJ0374132.1 hypothetical protein [Streptomyces sp. H10-C2]
MSIGHRPSQEFKAGRRVTDPDGSRAVCRNSETADARVLLERWWDSRRTEADWTLDATAHAEVGGR